MRFSLFSILIVQFYEKLGYAHVDDSVVRSGVFDCIRMRKSLPAR